MPRRILDELAQASRRRAFGLALMSVIALLALGVTTSAARSSRPKPVKIDQHADPSAGGLLSVACVSSDDCVAVDGGGGEVTFNPHHASAASRSELASNYQLVGVQCASATVCYAAGSDTVSPGFDAYIFRFNPAQPTGANSFFVGQGATGESCVGEVCVVIEDGGTYVRVAPGFEQGSSQQVSANPLLGVSCWDQNHCTAVDSSGRQITFNTVPAFGYGSRVIKADTIDASGDPSAVACPASTQCTAVDLGGGTATGGGEVTFDPTAAGARPRSTIAWGSALEAITCPTSEQCTAVGGSGGAGAGPGVAVTFNPLRPSDAVKITVAHTRDLHSVVCTSTRQCTAVDGGGNEVTFNPRSPAAPVVLQGSHLRVSNRRATARLACWIGNSTDLCRGTVTVSRHGHRLGGGSFKIVSGTHRKVVLHLTRGAASLAARPGGLDATMFLKLRGAGRFHQAIVLRG